jgi:hypothetical protein
LPSCCAVSAPSSSWLRGSGRLPRRACSGARGRLSVARAASTLLHLGRESRLKRERRSDAPRTMRAMQ